AAEKIVSYLEERYTPVEPRTVSDTGLETAFLTDLTLKNLYVRVTATGAELSEEMGLPYVGIIETIVESLRGDHLVEVRGGSGVTASSYQLAITNEGRTRARELLERNQYIGYAPVPLEYYNLAMRAQSLVSVPIPEDIIRRGLAHLVFNGR